LGFFFPALHSDRVDPPSVVEFEEASGKAIKKQPRIHTGKGADFLINLDGVK
jgi:hypothetical protein